MGSQSSQMEESQKEGNRGKSPEKGHEWAKPDGFCTEASVSGLRAWFEEARKEYCRMRPGGSSSVLIPVLIRNGEYHVLYEIRSPRLGTQPGEICFPGGRIEEGEDPEQAAVRETMEELCVREEQIEVIGTLEKVSGPGGTALYAFVGFLREYEGSYSKDEVGQVFTLPLSWILETEPRLCRIPLERRMPPDFPYESVPGGRDYKWREQFTVIPFYPGAAPLFWGEEGGTAPIPVLWGATARVTLQFAQLMRAAR